MVHTLTSPRIMFDIPDEINTSAIAVGPVTDSQEMQLCTGGRDGILRLYDVVNGEIKLLASHTINGSILSLRIADANNDGQMEIVVGNSIGIGDTPGSTGTVRVFRFAPSGVLELLAEQGVDRFVTSVYVTDVTGDGKNEIIAGGSDSSLRVYKMAPDNQLEELVSFKLDDMPLAIGTCDVIGDEIEEIVAGTRDSKLRIFKVSNGIMKQIDTIELPSPVISVAAGDILGDRKMELGVVTHDGSIRIFRNEENKLELFSKLEGVKAQSVRIAELNADHMDEIVVATNDYRVLFYNLYMAELNLLSEVDVSSKILSIHVGDVDSDDMKEVLVGLSNSTLKVISGLYHIIPKFEVSDGAQTGTALIGKLKVVNVSDEPVSGITGKIYWFPKDNLTVNPQQLRFDLGPKEAKIIEVQLMPTTEGTVIVRPIVLMWTDEKGQVRQVTTPETAILVEKGSAIAAPAAEAPVDIEPVVDKVSEEIAISPFASPDEVSTVFGASDSTPVQSELDQLREAEELLDRLFGEQVDGAEVQDIVDNAMGTTTEPAPETTTPPVSEVVENQSALVAEIRSRPPKPMPPGASPDSYAYLFKVMIIGEGAVGKTALVTRYTTGSFEKDYKTTIGSQFAVKLTYISPPESEYAIGIKLQAWDVAGQARFQAVRKMYYSGAAGVILVFDVTRRRSFAELPKWVKEADESIGTRVPMICIGNKIDLPDRAVSSEEAKKWAEDQGFLYMESSAKTGEGVADMFTVLAEIMWREAKKNQG